MSLTEQLEPDEREAVMGRFAPERGMRIYARGIRRRLAPMLEGDIAWQGMAWAALLSLGQVPVIRYGEEIGLGDCPSCQSAMPCACRCTGTVDQRRGLPIDRGMPGAHHRQTARTVTAR